MVECLGHQSEHLLSRLLEGDVLKPALNLAPLQSPAGRHVLGIAVERLVQDGQHEERPSGTACRLGEFLQYKHVAPLGVAGPIFEELAQLVDDQEQSSRVVTEAAEILVGLLEEADDAVSGRVR